MKISRRSTSKQYFIDIEKIFYFTSKRQVSEKCSKQFTNSIRHEVHSLTSQALSVVLTNKNSLRCHVFVLSS